MKKLLIVAAIMALFVYGCSEQMNPVEPGQASSFDATSTLAKVKPARVILVPDEPTIPPASTVISVSQPIVASVGGTVRLQGEFPDRKGNPIAYDISIEFQPDALPYDAPISISIDKTNFQDDGTVTFGPHGLVFNTPGTLLLKADNITFAKNAKTVKLYYLNNGIMEPMPSTWGSYVKKSDWNLVAGAEIPHFSRYAFGR